eukprot:11378589-Karenia_brevis.AAC.1
MKTGTGSMVEIVFDKQFDLEIAKSRVFAAKVIMQGQTEPCWLDYKKTKEQLRPGRVLTRADRYLTDVLQSKPE